MKKFALIGVGALALAACDPQVPDSGAGVGFSDYAQYEVERARREAAMRGEPLPAATAIVPPSSQGANVSPDGSIIRPAAPTSDGAVTSADLAAAGINTRSDATARATVAPVASAPPAAVGSNPQISDEQDFSAVADRESIESDAQRRARMAAAYQVLEAEALPVRNGQVEPNIVQYALQAPNDKGQPVFSRSILSTEGRFVRNCAKYRTPDEAQRDFLVRGGPQRDRLGLDPDGDGFACGWDPQAFRALAGN